MNKQILEDGGSSGRVPNKRVLITRAPERARTLVEALEQSGVEVVVESVTETSAMDPLPPLPSVEDFVWLAFTSQNAVTAFAKALGQAPLPAGMKVAAVGPATAEALRQRFGPPDLVAESSTGSELADTLRRLEDPPGPLLWPCAARTTPGFLAGLEAAAIEVTPWPCYLTRPVDASVLRLRLEATAPWHAVLFAAPSAVRAFEAAWPLPWRFRAVAIGPTTGDALRRLGILEPVICDGTGAEFQASALLQAVY